MKWQVMQACALCPFRLRWQRCRKTIIALSDMAENYSIVDEVLRQLQKCGGSSSRVDTLKKAVDFAGMNDQKRIFAIWIYFNANDPPVLTPANPRNVPPVIFLFSHCHELFCNGSLISKIAIFARKSTGLANRTFFEYVRHRLPRKSHTESMKKNPKKPFDAGFHLAIHRLFVVFYILPDNCLFTAWATSARQIRSASYVCRSAGEPGWTVRWM